MKNVKLKIKNEVEDGKWGSEEGPMFPGRNAEPLQCRVRNAECGMNTEGDPICRGGGRNIEFLRSKTSFQIGDTLKGGHRAGSARQRRTSNIEHPTSNIQHRTLNIEWGKPRQPLSGRTLPAQSMTMWASLKDGRGLARWDPGLRSGLPGRTRLNSLKLARTLILKFFLILKRKGQEPKP